MTKGHSAIGERWKRAQDIAAAVADAEVGALSQEEVAALVSGNHPAPVGKHPVGGAVPVSAPVVERARVLAKLYARMAAEDPRVIAAREDIAQDLGQLPAPDELPAWLDRFRSEAWDPALCDTAWDDPDRAAQLDRLGVERPTLPDGRRRTVSFPHPTGGGDFEVPADTWCGTVAATIERLTGDYPWRADRAALWLLCGKPVPLVVNASMSYSADGVSIFSMGVDYRISDGAASRPATPEERERAAQRERPPTDTRWRVTLTVDPAVSPAEVASMYAHYRAQMAPERVRHPNPKALALASFLLDQPEDPDEASGEVWDRWLKEWNRGAGRSHGRYDRAGNGRWNFRRDARSALYRLRYAGWRPPSR